MPLISRRVEQTPATGDERPVPSTSRPPSPGELAPHAGAPLRLLAAAVGVKGAQLLLAQALDPSPWLDALEGLANIALVALLAWTLFRLLVHVKRRLLWRVRRRLILSYIFVGFVPVLLLTAFFVVAGWLLLFQVSGYLLKRGIDDIVDDAVVVAATTAAELRRTPDAAAEDVLRAKVRTHGDRYPELSIVVVSGASELTGRAPRIRSAGSWRHAEPPAAVPGWVGVQGFGGLVADAPADAKAEQADSEREPLLVIRAVAVEKASEPVWVVVDVPVDEHVTTLLRDATGIAVRSARIVRPDLEAASPPRPLSPAEDPDAERLAFSLGGIFDYTEWDTGATRTLILTTHVSIAEIYSRVTATQSRFGTFTLAEIFVFVLGVLAVLFLIIQAVALVMGFALARSITGSIHQLFDGTKRVQMGDFTHRIRIATRDQLGELADSFNEMTASIQDLLRQREEKRRLEEELRIAREIQMSLLPRHFPAVTGLMVTALCIPAREVGGDYYDFFALGDRRVGVLIADVAGKGTSAAFYMAELKGLMLSLSRIYHSPKRLLVEANKILSANPESRSFITCTYAVIDVAAQTFTYARAGHTPLVHFTSVDGRPGARLLTPDGLVLGLQIDAAAERFDQLLAESVIPLRPGDVFVLFTDGITEAMHGDELFGEARLLAVIEQHADAPTDVLRERILRDVEAFVAGADQHDDMTMIAIRVEDMAPQLAAREVAAARDLPARAAQ
jgi:sigma-B regulation protein RsbU (phosphoserine phosphatase)